MPLVRGGAAHTAHSRASCGQQVSIEALGRPSAGWQDLAARRGGLWQEWRQLWTALAADERDPATHPAWLAAHLARLGDSLRDVRVFVCRSAERLLAVVPLEVVRCSRAGSATYFLSAPDDVPLEGASLAARRDDLPHVLDALLRTPVDGRRLPEMLEFARVDASHALLQLCGWNCRVEHHGARSVVDIPEDRGQLWDGLGGNLRGNLRRARNKLQRYSDARIDELTSETELAAAVTRFADVEARSWKAEQGTDLAADRTMCDFFARAMPELADEGRAVSHAIFADGRDIGVHLSLQFGDELLVHKISFDAGYAACAPGNLLLQHLLDDYAPRHGIRRINLVTCLPWHERWKPRTMATYRVQVFRGGVGGMWARARMVPLRDRVRSWLRRCGVLERWRTCTRMGAPAGRRS